MTVIGAFGGLPAVRLCHKDERNCVELTAIPGDMAALGASWNDHTVVMSEAAYLQLAILAPQSILLAQDSPIQTVLATDARFGIMITVNGENVKVRAAGSPAYGLLTLAEFTDLGHSPMTDLENARAAAGTKTQLPERVLTPA